MHDDCRRLLTEPPGVPTDPDRFSSNTLFGQPGIYPDGTAMSPAAGPVRTTEQARRLVVELDLDDGRCARRFDDPALGERADDPTVRAALALLERGPAASVLAAFVDGTAALSTLAVGEPASPGRVVGPLADGARGHQVVNERYAVEHPAVIAPSLAHAICHHPDRASNAEEATLHGLLAAVHADLLAGDPALGDLGTELSRRQASLTITLLNARAPGDWRASIRQPAGPGTIPGGNPSLQCPDLWSIPFTSRPDGVCDLDVPAPVQVALGSLAAASAPPPPATYGAALGSWLTAHVGDGELFGPCRRVTAGRALGLI